MSWANHYVGIPFEEKGRDRAGADCFGLVRLVLAEVFDISIPNELAYENTTDAACICSIFDAAVKREWLEAKIPKPGDVVVFKLRSPHLGIVCGDGIFLHIQRGKNAVIERLTSPMWRPRVIGFYRWCG